MEFKGTKGSFNPVDVSLGLSKGLYISGENQKYFICKIIENDRCCLENKANQLLISKAPEMLEMLKEFVYDFDNGMIEDYQILRDRFEQLIKEATKLK